MAIRDENRCEAMKRAVIDNRKGRPVEVFVRCTKILEHTSRMHKSWYCKWSDTEFWLDPALKEEVHDIQ